jgi:hypothetical protein
VFKVRAKNAIGLGAYSDELAITAASAPSAPTDVAITLDAEKLTVSWTASESNGATITGYKVKIEKQDGSEYVETDCTEVTATKCTIPVDLLLGGDLVLEKGTTIKAKVYATSNFDNSGDSESGTALLAFVPDAPGQPESDREITSNTQVGLKWTAPAFDNGAPIQYYYVYYNTGNENYEKLLSEITDTKLTLTEIPTG